ncbi:MAG: SBBP repeat-containing protein [candidate division WOR-3 bacterium]
MRRISMVVLTAFFAVWAQNWVARYNGPANDDDIVAGMVCDEQGNVYVAGTSHGGTMGSDIVIIKYSPAGESLWAVRVDGGVHGDDEAKAVAYRSGRVVVTGSTAERDSQCTDIITLVYNTDGSQRLLATFGTTNSDDAGLAVAIDNSRNVYVAGFSTGATTGRDMRLLKYNADGSLAWISGYITAEDDYPVQVASPVYPDVFIAGNSGNSEDYVTLRVNGFNGDTVWTRRYDGPAGGRDEARGLVVDPDRNVYVTGVSHGLNTNADFTTIKYSANGGLVWVRRYNGTSDGVDRANSITLDSSGYIYVTGCSQSSDGDFDFATVKYDTSGVERWVRHYDDPAGGDDEARMVTAGQAGFIYVTGYSAGTATGSDYLTIGYSGDGSERWVHRYDGPAGGVDEAAAVLCAGSRVYVTGTSEGAGTGSDFATLGYEPAGVIEPLLTAGAISRSRLTVIRNGFYRADAEGALMDATGRQVMRVIPGINLLGEVHAGLYFVCAGTGNRKLTSVVVIK